MSRKQIWQQIALGVAIWIIGSAAWGLLSTSLHVPAFDWGYIKVTASLVFSVLFFGAIVPFIKQSMDLHFARKQLELRHEEQDYQDQRASKKI